MAVRYTKKIKKFREQKNSLFYFWIYYDSLLYNIFKQAINKSISVQNRLDKSQIDYLIQQLV